MGRPKSVSPGQKGHSISALEFERRRRNMRQFDLSRKTGIFQSRLANIESGKIKPMEREIKAIAKALGRTPEVLKEIMRPEFITLMISRSGVQGVGIHYIQDDKASEAEIRRLFEKVRPDLEKINAKLKGKYAVRPLNRCPFRLEMP